MNYNSHLTPGTVCKSKLNSQIDYIKTISLRFEYDERGVAHPQQTVILKSGKVSTMRQFLFDYSIVE